MIIVSMSLPSDALSQHLPSYLGWIHVLTYLSKPIAYTTVSVDSKVKYRLSNSDVSVVVTYVPLWWVFLILGEAMHV